VRGDVRELTDRVEALLEQIESREKAEQLVSTLVTLYGEGLTRMLNVVRETPEGEQIVERFCADPFVASLLLVHDLHPVPLEVRLERALDSVRPYIHSHGGAVSILGVSGGVLDLHMSGSCDGCSASAQTLKASIERAVYEAAPEIIEVRANTASSDRDLLPRVLT
jgi:Fe-S cluster biogenesis protein NfuA